MAMLRAAVITLAALAVATLVLTQVMTGEESVTPPPTASASPSASGDAVLMKDMKFGPATLHVPVGTKVTWKNEDPMGHTVTPTDADAWGTQGSGNAPDAWLERGASWSFTFTKPGTYRYYCLPHAGKGADGEYRGMVGTIVVGGDAAQAPLEAAFKLPELSVVPDARAPARTLPGVDGVVRLELEAREVVAQLTDGSAYDFWTFNGTVPGPMLRVRAGDTVELTLRNDATSTHAHSIDLHAVTGPGGGAKATQVPPGGSATFRFQAINPGIYVYHCATPHIPSHIASGMYGLILVEPEGGLPPVDREYFVVQGEIYGTGGLGDEGMMSLSLSDLLDEEPDYFLMNGRVGALTGEGALKASVNETVRIYFGVGGFVPSSFHVIGEIFDKVYPEGASEPVSNVQTTLVPAGGAAIVEFKTEVPGTYLLVDHALTHAIDRGAAGALVVEGSENHAVYHGAETPGSGH